MERFPDMRIFAILLAATVLAAPAEAQQRTFPDVVDVKVTAQSAGAFDFAVTMTSPYDTAERYADAFRIALPDGKVLGELVLTHDHAGEQPFTRSLGDVRIPQGVRQVVVQGRDKLGGYGGKAVTATLPGR